MKKFILPALLFLACLGAAAQGRYDVLPSQKGGIIFAGDSITDDCEWNELFGRSDILNRGIDGDDSGKLLARVHELTRHRPDKLFIAIGTNDLPYREVSEVTANVAEILDVFAQESPSTAVYIMSVLPVGPEPMFFPADSEKKNRMIRELNYEYKKLCASKGATYINIHDSFLSDDGKSIDTRLYSDDLHLCGEGYKVWRDLLVPYVQENGQSFSRAFQAGKDRRADVFRIMSPMAGCIEFVGSSIFEDCEWKEAFGRGDILNRGIDGDTVLEIAERLPELSRHRPSMVFLEAGAVDITSGSKPEELVPTVSFIMENLRESGTNTKVHVLGVLPATKGNDEENGRIRQYNALLEKLCRQQKAVFIDLSPLFADEDGFFNPEYGTGNRKLSAEGYRLLKENLGKYVK